MNRLNMNEIPMNMKVDTAENTITTAKEMPKIYAKMGCCSNIVSSDSINSVMEKPNINVATNDNVLCSPTRLS
eukprot:CAMPEP_0202692418 /NCGR_PEP_ID=MMETSP1385-20130828/6806_1 /ASSEMBLY_ACC=CAM_ASM_000861 /TAXON_ID=933848 /ORGANISM="Elphidium margaritaceum" /LENGTH=72 /DNA_ID=CAMNT_0049347945 /DNA_START=88 /DNA_END=306 /DNA_ORIENTATION=-